ncbi:MAG TPA: acyl carrier protein [Chthoniobacterales bacterium]|jgi:acyl carrier protein|nr:acyl carrier protein [Chthoniobacterales bacterium]
MSANNLEEPLGDVREKVRAFVLEYAADRGVTAVQDDEPILTNNIIDSLGSLRMIDFMETAFPLTIEDTDMLPENFQTINETVKFIERKLGISTPVSANGTEEPDLAPTPSPELIAI